MPPTTDAARLRLSGLPGTALLAALSAGLLASGVLLSGCQSTPEATEGDDAGAAASAPPAAATAPAQAQTPPQQPATFDSPLYREAIAKQALRLRRLQFLESAGNIDIRWKDESGSHFENCQLELYVMPPAKTALSIKKLGDRYVWIGSDEEQWWVFQLAERPSSVSIHRWTETPNEIMGQGISIVSPKAILQLAGLTAYPELPAAGSAETLSLVEDATAKTIVVERKPVGAGGASGGAAERGDRLGFRKDPIEALPSEPPVRWTIDATTFLPKSIEVLDASGKTLVRSTVDEYVSAEIDGAPPGDFPRVARHVRIERMGADGQPVGDSIHLALDKPSGRAQRMKPRYFSLTELMQSLQPDEVYVRVKETGANAAPKAGPAS